MINEVESLRDLEVTCTNCEASCCRLEAMLFNDTEIPDKFIVINTRGESSMKRLEDGWCAALNRKTMTCTIYEKRPWICREFEMGEDECISARAANR
ncbi:MAG: YkgJ family cysteine cluster protein [Deltaproteobacteria bacterium]|nr:YkgJ family cysteine cluster protein [Deltaproteobacteria bacterium]